MQDVFWITVGVLAYATSVVLFSEYRTGSLPAVTETRATAATSHDEPIQPLPPARPLDPAVVALGERLFHDRRLAGDGVSSCAHCHDLALAGIDGRRIGVGQDGRSLGVNVPTVLNAGLQFRQFWDGRAETLEAQVDGPLLSASEMGSSWEQVLAVLESDPEYVAAFQQAFGSPPTADGVRLAIAEFERTLVTPNARFDLFLRGDDGAITAEERAGYALFKDYGCVGCHQGAAVGGNMFQRLGIAEDYFAGRDELTRADLGRFNVTGNEADRHVFKVPSLRNVARTAPYFHDGSAETLGEAIRVMARFQLGREMPDADVERIEAFLRTLDGQLPAGP